MPPTAKTPTICFETWHNGRRLGIAGAPGHGVLTAIVHWVRRDPINCPKRRSRRSFCRQELRLQVGGLYRDEHLDWVDRPLRAGDEVRIRVLSGVSADDPRRRRPSLACGVLRAPAGRTRKGRPASLRLGR